MFQTDRQRAIAYAAYKELEKILKDDSSLPPGEFAVGGESITITLPSSLLVRRQAGENGDGVVMKKATQNLYGYGVWALFLKRLQSFNQASKVRDLIKQAWMDALVTGEKVEEKLEEIDSELADFVVDLKKQPAPKRPEPTPRMIVKDSEEISEVIFESKRQAA